MQGLKQGGGVVVVKAWISFTVVSVLVPLFYHVTRPSSAYDQETGEGTGCEGSLGSLRNLLPSFGCLGPH